MWYVWPLSTRANRTEHNNSIGRVMPMVFCRWIDGGNVNTITLHQEDIYEISRLFYVLSNNLCTSMYFFIIFFIVRSAWPIGFFIPVTTANDLRLRRIFYPRFYPLDLFSYLNSWERASVFPFECTVLNKDTTGTIFITSLVWRGPWLVIEPGTSHPRSQHYTTRLSRKRFTSMYSAMLMKSLFIITI